jgi:hypothetical protein
LFIVTNATYQVTLHDSDCAESGAKVRLFYGTGKFLCDIFFMYYWVNGWFCVFLKTI